MKPIFGSTEQIKEIKNFQYEQENKAKLNTYEVCLSFEGDFYITVDAETEEEAIEEAEEEFSLIDADDYDICHKTARKINECQQTN